MANPGKKVTLKFKKILKLVRQRSYWRRSGEYVQRHVCFVNIQSSLHENVVFSVCACMGNAAYIIFIMWNSISGLDAWHHFRFNISCGVAVMMRVQQKNDRNGGVWQSGISKALAEYVQRRVCYVNVQSSLRSSSSLRLSSFFRSSSFLRSS